MKEITGFFFSTRPLFHITKLRGLHFFRTKYEQFFSHLQLKFTVKLLKRKDALPIISEQSTVLVNEYCSAQQMYAQVCACTHDPAIQLVSH